MSTKEEHYLAICELPACVPKDEIEDLLKKQLNLRGQILDSEEVPGIEANKELTRWVCLLQSAEEVKRLLDEKEVELMYQGLSYNVRCQKPIPCEIPERWANIQIPPWQPEVPFRRALPNIPLDQHTMASGFYENLQPPPHQYPFNPNSKQSEQMPEPPSGQPSDQNMPGMPGQHGYPHVPPEYPQQPSYSHPMFGYPQNFGPKQQQHFPQAPYYPQFPPNFVQDPKTGGWYFAPSPNPMNPNQTNTNQTPGQPAGPPPAYYDKPHPGTDLLNQTKPFDLQPDTVVSSHAIHDQEVKEAYINETIPKEEESTFDDGGEGEDSENEDSDIEQLSAKLVVSNLPTTAHEDLLRFFFESKRNFGGLEVIDVEYDEENAMAIIEFENASDVDVILDKAPIKLTGQVVHVERYEPEREEPVDLRVVQVSGPVDVVRDIETVELYFESKKRSGGGDIDSLKYDEDLNVLLVTFEEEEVAQRVIEREKHVVKKQTLEVTQFIPSKSSTYSRNTRNSDEFVDAVEMIKDTVKVSGVLPSIRGTVEMYFENSKRSGGGDYEDCWSDDNDEDVIYIKFSDEEVALRVVTRDKHEVQGCKLTAELYTPTKDKPADLDPEVETVDKKEPVQDTIKVYNVSPAIRSTVELYFENIRRSGGGEISKVWNDEEEEDVIYIRFTSEEVAKRVAERSHSVESQDLNVTIYIPPEPLPSYENKVLIKGLNTSTSQDGLFNFIEAKSGLVPETLDYHENEEDIVMVTFEGKADIQKLEDIFQKFKLEGNTLKVMPVPISNCIMVAELPDKITKDTVQFYFENQRKSGGGDVEKVTMNEDDTCLVYFIDYKVIENVLDRDHYFSKQKVFVQRYQDCLGKPEGDIKERKLKMPAPIVFKDLDKYKVKFLTNSEVYKQKFDKLLQTCHSKIRWPKDADGSLVVECTISQSVDGCYRLVKTWKAEVQENVKSYMETLAVQKAEILQDAWQNVLKKLNDFSIANPDNIALYLDKKASSVCLAGLKEDVTSLKKSLDSIITDVLNEMEKERQKVHEVVNTWKSIETRMLLAEKFYLELEKTYEVNIKIDIKKNEIVFDGSLHSVRDAKLELYNTKELYRYNKLEGIPKVALHMYMLTQTKDYIVKQLKAKRIAAVWEVVDNSLNVCSREENLKESSDIIKNCARHTSIPLKKEQLPLINSEKWSSRVVEIQSTHVGRCVIEVSEDGNKIMLSSTDDIIDDNADAIRKFLRLNTMYTDKVTCTKNAYKLIKKHHSREIEKVAKDLEEYNVQIIFADLHSRFDVKGTEDGVKKAKEKMNEVLRKVKKQEHDIEKPGLGEYMTTPKGKDNINTIEEKYPVVVATRGQDDEDYDDDSGGTDDDHKIDGIDIYAHGTLYDCREIYCGKGDMSDMNVDIIVNTVNEKLNLSGGLGKVLVRKGGKKIETECQGYIKNNGRLGEGEAFISTAGNLKAKHIIHIRGPVWNEGEDEEENMLEEAIFKCMKMASTKSATSVAIPAVSCGASGFPVHSATSIIVAAVKNYFREDQESSVTHVYFCDIKHETAESFSAAMSKEIPSVNITKNKQTARPKPVPRKPPGSRPRGSYQGAQATFSGDSMTIKNVTITVVKAEIAREKVDVIVNTTARNLDLKNGAVSASLLKGGGSGLQDELSTNYPNGIKDADVAVTDGHNLKCDCVVHTSPPHFDSKNPSKSFAVLRKIMNNCLMEAEKKRVKSIAFPAIGTGNLGYPKDLVAREMFQSVISYSFKKVNDVRFIVYQKDHSTIQAFLNELQRRQTPGGATAEVSDDDDDFEIDDDNDESEDNMETETTEGKSTSHLNIIIKQGDITSEPAECIVNSSNEDLDLSRGAVAQSLSKKGGKKLAEALDKLRDEMKTKRFVVTDAPNMKCKKIIHIVAADSFPEWKNAVINCLTAAEKHKLSSIAFPALGTGVKYKSTDMAPIMINAVREFEKSAPTTLTEVRIVIFQEAMVKDFQKALNTQPKDIGAKPKRNAGTFKKAKKTETKVRQPMRNTDKVTFVFYSLSPDKIKEAIKKLQSCIEKEIDRKNFEDSVIKKMDKSHVAQVRSIVNEYKLKLHIDTSNGRLEVTGLTANVNSAALKIHQLFREVQTELHTKQAAEILTNVVQWFYIEVTNTGQNLQPYDKDMNYRIESAFKSKDKNIKFKVDDSFFIIDFTDMIEYPEGNKADSMSVIRRDLVKNATYKVPESWGDFKGDMKVDVLASANQDYKTVEATFLASVGAGFIVTKIERIMNRTLWTQYQAKKQQLEKQNPKGTQNERRLWHGTAPEAVDNINAHGFNRSYCGKNATYYGAGVYFATNASYSARDNYSRADASGVKKMYYCLVLTGEYTQGKEGMRVAPKKGSGDDTALYDSVVENVKNPGMFIIFHDTQAYPEYLVSFKKQ